jgi:hypothetical protein
MEPLLSLMTLYLGRPFDPAGRIVRNRYLNNDMRFMFGRRQPAFCWLVIAPTRVCGHFNVDLKRTHEMKKLLALLVAAAFAGVSLTATAQAQKSDAPKADAPKAEAPKSDKGDAKADNKASKGKKKSAKSKKGEAKS